MPHRVELFHFDKVLVVSAQEFELRVQVARVVLDGRRCQRETRMLLECAARRGGLALRVAHRVGLVRDDATPEDEVERELLLVEALPRGKLLVPSSRHV